MTERPFLYLFIVWRCAISVTDRQADRQTKKRIMRIRKPRESIYTRTVDVVATVQPSTFLLMHVNYIHIQFIGIVQQLLCLASRSMHVCLRMHQPGFCCHPHLLHLLFYYKQFCNRNRYFILSVLNVKLMPKKEFRSHIFIFIIPSVHFRAS